MSETQDFEDHEDSMEPGELKVTPPGTPILNSEGPLHANEDKRKVEDGNEKYENAKSLSSLDILKTYKDQDDDRYIPVQDIPGNSFYDGNFPPNHPGQMIMQSRGFPLYRGGGRGINIKARLGFRGGHRGAFFQGRGRGFPKRNSNEIRDFQEVKKPFKIKLMYTKTKPSLSWHPNPNYIGPQKLDLSKNKSLDSSKTESKKHDDKIEDKSLDCNKFEKDCSKNNDKKSSSHFVDKKKIKESKPKKDKDKKESKKKSYSSSKERSKNDKKREKEQTKLSSKKGSKKKDSDDRQSEKCEKKSIEGDKIKERKSKSSDRSHNSSKTRETEERKRYSRNKNSSKSSKSPDRKRKTRFDKSPEKLINKRNKSLERAFNFKEISKDDKKIGTNKEFDKSPEKLINKRNKSLERASNFKEISKDDKKIGTNKEFDKSPEKLINKRNKSLERAFNFKEISKDDKKIGTNKEFDKSPEKLINKRNKSLERASNFKEISKDDKKIGTNKEFDKSPEKLINKRNKSLERASNFKEISKDDKKYATNKECSTSKKSDDHKSKEKSLAEPKTSIENEKQDKCKKEKELKNIENKELNKKEKEKGKCNSFDMFKENSPNTPEPLESTTPILQNIPSIVLIPNSSKNDFKTCKKSKKEKDNTKRNRTSSINTSSLSFVDELYEEELEKNFPLTKDGSIQAVESKKKQKQNKTEKSEKLKNKTDELDTNSSPDTEDYQDMWEEDEDLLPSSQSSEQNKPENRLLIKQKTHEEILKNIKVEMDDELEIIKRNQDVIENEIFKNLGTNSELIKIKQERISTDELVIIKREKNSDESSSSSDDSEDDEDSSSTSSSSSTTSSSSSSNSSTSDSDVSSNIGKSSKSDDEIKDGFSTPLFVNPSPPPELATSLNVKDIPPPLKMFCPPSDNKSTSKDKLSEDSIAIQNSIEEIMEQNEMNFNQRKDSKKSPAYCKSKQVTSANLKTQPIINNLSLDTPFNNQNKEPNEKGECGSSQKFVIAMQDIYEQFLQSVTSAGVDLSCENEAKSPRSNVTDFNKEKPMDDQSNATKTSEYLEDEIDNKKDSKNEKESTTSGKKVESHTIQKLQPIKMDLPKPKKIHNIIPLDEIGAPHLTNKDLQTELNSLKLSELKSPQFDLAISPKTEEPVIMLAPEKIPAKIIEKNSPTNSKNSTDESTSSSSDSDDSDSDETSSISSDSEMENPRSILGVEFETLQKFTPEDRKNLRALEKRLNTLQSWSAVDEDDKEVFKGLKNILEREIELIVRKYIPITMKSPVKESTMVPIPKESPKEEKALNILKSPITIKQKAMASSPFSVSNGIFDLNKASDKVIAPINTILSVSVPFPTIFSIGAEMAKNNAALQKSVTPMKNEVPKMKEDSSKNSSKSSSKSLKSDSDFKSRRSKSPSDRSHKSSSKRSTHSPSRKSPTKHSTKDSKRDRSKSPYSRDERRKSSPYHKNSSSVSSRRARADSPNKKQSSRHKHRRSSSVSRVTSRHSRSPGTTTTKRFRARTPTPPRPSKARGYDKLTNKMGQRKSDFHRSRSFSRSRSRSITPREGTITFRGRGRIRNSISPKRCSFSPRRSSISPRRSSISPRRSVNSRRSASPRGRNFSRSPIPFRPPSPSVSPPLSGNDSSRSPKRLRSLSRSRTRSRSLSPHIHKIRRLDDVHHTHWNTDESNSNNQYYAENTYGYATSPSRMAMITNEEPPRRIDTVIGRVIEDDSLYQSYGSGSYSGYEYIQPQPSGIPMQHYEFDFNAPSNVLYPHSENSDYYYHQDYQDNRSYSHINQADVVDPQVTNCTKTVAVQKGNVLEIVPSAVLPEDLDSALVKVTTKENIKIEKQDEINIEFDIKNEETLFISTEQKKKKSPSWKREVHRRQMLAAVLKLHRDSDGNMKSILIKQEEKSREKKSVLFADGIKPGSGPIEEKSTVLKKEKRTKKERKEKKKNKIALENKENTNLLELLNVDTNIDPELENAPPPPPPPGSPPPRLDQPIYMRASSPPDFTYFHFDSAVSCMYFSKNPVPIPPRLLNGSFPSPPRSDQINQQNQVQQSQQQQPQQQQQQQHHQVQLQHQIQLQGTQQSIQMQILQQQMFVNPTNQSNVLSSISNASDRLLTQNRKITSPIPIVSSNTFSSSTPTGVRSSLVQRFNTVSHFGPSNISMSSCNFSIPPPNIPPPIIPSQSHGTISTGGVAVSSIQLLQNPRNFIQHNANVINVQQQSPTLEQIKRATATLPFQSNVQTNNPISITSPIPIPSISSNSNNINSGNIINTYNKNNSNNINNNSNIHNVNSNSNSPAFSSDSCFWKKDNTNSNSTVLSSTSSPIALTQPIAIQKIFKNEIVKHINLSPNASLSPGQKKVTGKCTEAP